MFGFTITVATAQGTHEHEVYSDNADRAQARLEALAFASKKNEGPVEAFVTREYSVVNMGDGYYEI